MTLCKAQCQAGSPTEHWQRCPYQKQAALLCSWICSSKRCIKQLNGLRSLTALPACTLRPQAQQAGRASQHWGVNQKQRRESRLQGTV